MGRKPLPDHLKVLQGTARPDRMNADAPDAPQGVSEPPEWLNTRAAELFQQVSAILDGIGLASPVDVASLALLASRLEEVEATSAVLDDLGRTYVTEGPSGQLFRPRPEIAMRNESMRHTQSLLAEFGLTPAARSKVKAGPPPQENPFAALDRI
ncbi:P27 family phage terminase small subunit [Roseobacter litoralis]|uniref:P27 family phage terminase small subunit n=1 Tax=Roseobacter litoralis TaxID=42443 RepID=UPI0024940EE1|nr:P27 family phage terminase small subunit [Roseobacter litoralis]